MQEWCDGLDDYARRFFRFVSTRLLQVEDLKGATAVAAHLAVVGKEPRGTKGPKNMCHSSEHFGHNSGSLCLWTIF